MSAKAPALADFRRIVSSRLVAAWSMPPPAGRGRRGGFACGHIARLHQENGTSLSSPPARSRWAARCSSCRKALSSSRIASCRRRRQIALARTWAEVLGKHGITASQFWSRRRPESRRRILMRARPSPSCWSGAASRSSRERHRRDHRNPLRRQRPPGRPRRHHGDADLLVLLSDVDGLLRRAAPPRRQGQAIPPRAAHHCRD